METPDMGMFDTSEPPRPLVPQASAMVNSVWGMASSSSFVHVFGFFTPVIVKVLSSLHTSLKSKGSPFFSVTSSPQLFTMKTSS